MYQVATGYNNAAGLTTLTHQPFCMGIRAGRRVIAGNGMLIEDGLGSADLVFNLLKKAQYSTVLAEFFITSAPSAQITMRMPRNSDRAFANFNAIVLRPDLPVDGSYEFAYRNITLRLTGIEALP